MSCNFATKEPTMLVITTRLIRRRAIICSDCWSKILAAKN